MINHVREYNSLLIPIGNPQLFYFEENKNYQHYYIDLSMCKRLSKRNVPLHKLSEQGPTNKKAGAEAK